MRNLTALIALLIAAAPAVAQVSYIWSRTDSVVAAPRTFKPSLDVPATGSAHAHGWAMLTAAYYARVIAPALEKLPPVPGQFAAATDELAAFAQGSTRLAQLAVTRTAELTAAAARLEVAVNASRGAGRWIEGALDAHVIPDIANAFRQVAPLSIELEGTTNRHALLVYKVEQGFVTIANQDDAPALPATRYMVLDPAHPDARTRPECYLMWIPAMKAYSFSPLLAKSLQAGPIFTGRIERLAAEEIGSSSRSAD